MATTASLFSLKDLDHLSDYRFFSKIRYRHQEEWQMVHVQPLVLLSRLHASKPSVSCCRMVLHPRDLQPQVPFLTAPFCYV